MYCTSCGSQNPDNANFCSNCGREISVQPSEPQPKVHHPWMTAQEPPETPPEQQKLQDKGEVPPDLVQRIQGWSRTKKILWGVVIGFVLLTCVAVAVAEPVEDDTAEALATEQSESNDETPSCSGEEFQEYALSIAVPLSGVPLAAGEFERLFGQAGRSPTLLLNEKWQDEIEANLKVMENFVSAVRDAEPPESVRHIHAILLEAADELDKSTGLTGEGVRESDVSLIESGLPHFELYVEKLGEYNSEIRDYCESDSSSGKATTSKGIEDVNIVETRNLPPTIIPPAMPEPTRTPKPKVSEKDRIAGKHCEKEFEKLSQYQIQQTMVDALSDNWFGYDPASLKMTGHRIYPLGHELNTTLAGPYGDPWSDREEHVALAEFTVKNDDGRRVRRKVAFWVLNDDCEIVMRPATLSR